ncbi:MAG: IclR family transcriptional regulator [Nocardiopsaceae bacterium]|nr:IclR family transcriptional regulator [Nocardiopsaceae bacterium]
MSMTDAETDTATGTAADEPPLSVLGRAFALLGAFGPDASQLTLSDLAARTGLALSTTHRLARELVRLGALERADGWFYPGMRLFELAQLTRPIAQLRQAALPFMEDLYEATHQIVNLGVLDGFEIVYIEKISGHRAADVPSRAGGRIPAHCTAMGKAQLAFLPRPRLEELSGMPLTARTRHSITDPGQLRRELELAAERGAAYDREEVELGIACIAAPILDARRQPVAALSVTGTVSTISSQTLTPAVRTAAIGVARALRRYPGRSS